jgi:YD repeat-containing protein
VVLELTLTKEGRLTQIDYGKGQTVDYTYDPYGRIATATTGQGVKTTYTWDALDRKSSEQTDLPTGGSYTLIKWSYTPSNRPKTVSVFKGTQASPPSPFSDPTLLQETRYDYDELGRYTQISINGTPKVWYDYNPATLALRQKRFFNGWTIQYEQDETGHPKSLITLDAEGKKIKEVSYVWNQHGKLETRILDGIHHRYHYDPLGRLTEVVKTNP